MYLWLRYGVSCDMKLSILVYALNLNDCHIGIMHVREIRRTKMDMFPIV
jgi:hypothetical protein